MPQEKPKPPTLADLAIQISRRLGLIPSGDALVDVVAPRPAPVVREREDGRLEAQLSNIPEAGSGLMEEITLGSATRPPLGVHLPPTDTKIGPAGTNLPPNVNAAWEEARARWPFISRYVKSVQMNRPMRIPFLQDPDKTPMFFDSGEGSININPNLTANMEREALLELLAHELTHVGQQGVAPPSFLGRRTKGMLEQSPFKTYHERLGEDQAFATQFDLLAQHQSGRSSPKRGKQ
jgi:hypothetical protein